MGSNMKLAAQRLLKIADDLEREAADNTFFVCDGCNHTSSLKDINAKRKMAGENHKVKRIANVSVNDSVTCLACGGKMSYVPTDSSEKYYVESEDTGADIFEPVDERDNEDADVAAPEKDEAPAIDESVSETSDTTETPEGDETVSETSDTTETPEGDKTEDTTEIADYDGNPDMDKEDPKDEGIPEPEGVTPDGIPAPDSDTGDSAGEPGAEGVPGEDAPAPEGDIPEGDTPEETPDLEGDVPDGDAPASEGESDPVTEETVTDETVEEPMSEGTPDEEAPIDEDGVVLPKKDVPKFEKIPKDASEDFLRAIAKYSI
jgi:hypothetical protein